MLKGRDLLPLFEKFLGKKQKASVTQDARVQVRTPDGRHYDIAGVNLVENKILGAKESHRLVISTHEELAKMGKGQGLKILAYLVLLIYWATILLESFLLWSSS